MFTAGRFIINHLTINKTDKWSPNSSQRPRDAKVELIVLHYTAGDFDSSMAWLMNPSARVSAHYLISRKGDIWQLVPDEWKAWHAGTSGWMGRTNVNDFSIGIELVGWRRGGFTDLQLNSLLWLTRDLMVKYGLTTAAVVGHADVAPGRKPDPDGAEGQFPWGLFKLALRCDCAD